MNFFAALAIMMAMGINVNAKVGAKHNEFHNNKGIVEVRYDGHHDMYAGHRDHFVVNGNAAAGVAAGVVATVSLAALIGALAH